jgi:hypothetical protein
MLLRLIIEQTRFGRAAMGHPIIITKTERRQASITSANVRKLTPCVHLHTLGEETTTLLSNGYL